MFLGLSMIAWQHGLHRPVVVPIKPFCPHGHAMIGDNVMRTSHGPRCRACARLSWRRSDAKRRGKGGRTKAPGGQWCRKWPDWVRETALALHRNDGLGRREIAKRMGLHPNTVRFWLETA